MVYPYRNICSNMDVDGFTMVKVTFIDFHDVLEDMRIINSLKHRKRIIKKIRKQMRDKHE